MDAVSAVAAFGPSTTLQAGPGASFADPSAFQGAMEAATRTQASHVAAAQPAAAASAPGSPAVKSMFSQLDRVDGEARSVAAYAEQAAASNQSMNPGEVIALTMRCHEFMFHCQLTSNIANRSSDGLQQLFRQQS